MHLIYTICQQLQPVYEAPLAHQYAWWLIQHVTGKSKIDLIMQPDMHLSPEQEQQLDRMIEQLMYEHKPIAYILGDVPFGDLTIQVAPPVLIPRPETEQWVLQVIDQIKKSKAHNLHILDMCTGSGCIGLLLAHALPNTTVYGVDISEHACALATKNKQRLGITNFNVIQSNLYAQIPHDLKFDIIVTNPPYISHNEYRNLDQSVINWEDEGALKAEDNGLALIERILAEAPHKLRPHAQLADAQIAQLHSEIGWQQKDAVKKLMQKNGYNAITSFKDHGGKDRVVSGSIANVATAEHN